MTCRQAEKSIYLSGELTPRQREELDMHLVHCSSCQLLRQQVIYGQATIRDAFGVSESACDPVLTARIIHAVENTGRRLPRPFAFIFDALTTAQNPIRYAMTALSILMMGVFLFEYNAPSLPDARSLPPRAGVTRELNSPAFTRLLRGAGREARDAAPSRYACLIRCLRFQDADCTSCLTDIKNKKNGSHEES